MIIPILENIVISMRRHTRHIEPWLSRHRHSLSWTVYTLPAVQTSVCQIQDILRSEKGYWPNGT